MEKILFKLKSDKKILTSLIIVFIIFTTGGFLVYKEENKPGDTIASASQKNYMAKKLISDLKATPSEITPGKNKTAIIFNLLKPAKVNIKIFNSKNDLVRELLKNLSLPKGKAGFYWAGTNENKKPVPPGEYKISIEIKEKTGNWLKLQPLKVTVLKTEFFPGSIKEGKISINKSENKPGSNKNTSNPSQNNSFPKSSKPLPNGPRILDAAISPATIKSGQVTTVYFNLSEQAKVTLKVYSSGGLLVYSAQSSGYMGKGQNYIIWNGKNNASGKLEDAAPGNYSINVSAVNSKGVFGPVFKGRVTVK